MLRYKNVRFWDAGCKLTLSPGEVSHHRQGWPTEEGYGFVSTQYVCSNDGYLTVTKEVITGGRDCDGELRTTRTYRWLPTNETTINVGPKIMAEGGEWIEEGQARVYDQFAQLANY